MPLRDPKVPYKTIRELQITANAFQSSMIGLLLNTPPNEEKEVLEYFKEIREKADRLYTLALRTSQVAATAMECLQPGSSNQIKLPEVNLKEKLNGPAEKAEEFGEETGAGEGQG